MNSPARAGEVRFIEYMDVGGTEWSMDSPVARSDP